MAASSALPPTGGAAHAGQHQPTARAAKGRRFRVVAGRVPDVVARRAQSLEHAPRAVGRAALCEEARRLGHGGVCEQQERRAGQQRQRKREGVAPCRAEREVVDGIRDEDADLDGELEGRLSAAACLGHRALGDVQRDDRAEHAAGEPDEPAADEDRREAVAAGRDGDEAA
eukprot:7379750-Prymnesium_polylepis.1